MADYPESVACVSEALTYVATRGNIKLRGDALPYLHVIWDLDDDPSGNVRHIAEHGISKAEVVTVLADPETREESRSSGRPVAIGTTSTGRTILVVYEQVDRDTVYPVTAYDLED